MKKKIILLLGLFSVLLVGCGNKSQLTKVKQSESEADLLGRVGTSIVEYELKINDEITRDSLVSVRVDKYEYGKYVDTILQSDLSDITDEKKIDISLEAKFVGLNKEKLTLKLQNQSEDIIFDIPENYGVYSNHRFNEINLIERDSDYYLSALLFSDEGITYFKKTYDAENFMKILSEYSTSYVLTLNITNDWLSCVAGGVLWKRNLSYL